MRKTKQQQIDELTEALAFYADPATHTASEVDGKPVWPILDDKGRRARAALDIPEPPTFEEQLAALSRGVQDVQTLVVTLRVPEDGAPVEEPASCPA